MTRVIGWVLPGAAVLAAALSVDRLADEAVVGTAVEGYPWVAYGVALLLSVVFHRSRVAIAVGLVMGAHVVFASPVVPALHLQVTGAALAALFGGIALGRDRGLISPAGGLQAAAVLAGVLVAAFLVWEAPQDISRILSWAPLPADLAARTGLGQVVLGSFALASVASLWSVIRWRGPVDRALLWTLPLLALAVREGGSAESTVYLMAAAILLGLSVLETSYAMAYRDDLTGLPARRALMRDLEALGSTYTLAMVDVDHFKKFNDRHGHDVGDQVLKMVAAQLARTTGGGKAYRYGGEEFTLVFAGALREDAMAHLDAVREAVGAARFNLRSWARPRKKPSSTSSGRKSAKQGGRTLSVTVSIGVADSTLKDATTETVLKKADQALYRAKKAGRNRVSK